MDKDVQRYGREKYLQGSLMTAAMGMLAGSTTQEFGLLTLLVIGVVSLFGYAYYRAKREIALERADV